MASTQITTTALLKQFATMIDDDEVTLTSKLGTSTVSRVRFKSLNYPSTAEEQECFVRDLIESSYPKARQALQGMFEECISDQARAANTLLSMDVRTQEIP